MVGRVESRSHHKGEKVWSRSDLKLRAGKKKLNEPLRDKLGRKCKLKKLVQG